MANWLETSGGIITILSFVVPILGTAGVYTSRLFMRTWRSYAIVTKIADELKPNGGGSIRDRIDSIGTALEENAAWCSITLSLIPHSVFKSDSRGHFIWVSRHLADELGEIPEDFMGYGWLSTVSPLDRMAVRTEWMQAVQDGRNFSVTFTTCDGRTANIEAHPYFNKRDRSLRGHIGLIRFDGSFIGR